MWRGSPSHRVRERTFAGACGLFGALLLVGPAFAGGSVKGAIELPDRSLVNQARLGETVIRLRPESAVASVPAKAAVSAVEVRHGSFAPRVVALAAGSTVEFVNRDQHIHNIASSSPSKAFDLGMSAPGETGRVLFDREGVVRVFCKAEPPMDGWIVVAGNPWFSVANEQGAYEMSDVPVGSWIAEAWNPHFAPVRSPVHVHRDGEVVRLDFRFDEVR